MGDNEMQCAMEPRLITKVPASDPGPLDQQASA